MNAKHAKDMKSKDNELQARNALYRDELSKMNADHEKATEDLKRKHQQDLNKRDDEQRSRDKQYREQLDTMEVMCTEKLTKLQTEHRD